MDFEVKYAQVGHSRRQHSLAGSMTLPLKKVLAVSLAVTEGLPGTCRYVEMGASWWEFPQSAVVKEEANGVRRWLFRRREK